jgi:dihydroflavonol-4-reductase
LRDNGFKKATPRKAPSLMVKFLSLFNREMKGMLPFLDAEISADISATKQVFNWEPIPFDKTILDTAKSIQPLL